MAATNNMHNLTTLIKRLEAATSRLEDIAASTELPNKEVPVLNQSNNTSPPDSSTTVATPGNAKEASEPLAESIDDFDTLLKSSVDKYVKLSNQIGGLVAQQATGVLEGFREQRKFLLVTTKATKPDVPFYQVLLQPTNAALMAATDLKESNRHDPMYTQLSTVADGIMVLAWVTVEHRPYAHVEECLSSAEFFGNRVLKEQKDKDTLQIEWVQSFYQIIRDLAAYVKQHFATGIIWNSKGELAEKVVKLIASAPAESPASASTSPPPPPPPPPGPAPVLDIKSESAPLSAAVATPGGLGAVFSDLKKGDAVTKGLRKVDKSEMTHKNPSLRAGSTVRDVDTPRGKSPAPGKKPKPESMRMKKPSRKELEGNKWTIENYDKEPQPIEIEASLAHSILISRCNNTTIIVRGKANQVTVENSSRLSLVVESLVSTVDVVKAQNFALQVMGMIPTVMLDQVDGAQVYLSKESTATKLFSSKSDGVNLNVISGPDEDYKEVPLPSQICSFYDEAREDLISEIVAHAG